jgi:nucleotide-binding universal stress UspA family protein
MQIRHIVAATDESDAGRQAVRAAITLAERTGGRVTVVRAIPAPRAVLAGRTSGAWTAGDAANSGVEQLRQWVEADLHPRAEGTPISFAIAYGLPGVEISRFAEHERADVVVLGRKARSMTTRVAVGDTADAVARRCPVPCLFVPATGAESQADSKVVLAAVDGSDRGMRVLTAAENFAQQVHAPLHVVTVEPPRAHESPDLAAAVPSGHGANLRRRVRLGPGRGLELRHGQPVEQILAAVDKHRPAVLVIGCHRGGPSGILDAGSTARRIAHTAPCAILTVPL